MIQKRSPWIYVILVLMLVALLAFSGLPLVNSIVQTKALAKTPTNIYGNLTPSQIAELENQIKGYELVVEREPDNEYAWQKLLELKLKQEDIPGTIEPLTHLAAIHPEIINYQLLLAQANQITGDLPASEAIYRQILARYPDNISALQGLRNLFLEQKQFNAAISLLQEKISQVESNPNSKLDITAVRLLLAEVYAREKNYDQAIKIYDRAITEKNDDFRPLLAKALLLQEIGQAEQAQNLLDQALQLAPANYQDDIKKIADLDNSAS